MNLIKTNTKIYITWNGTRWPPIRIFISPHRYQFPRAAISEKIRMAQSHGREGSRAYFPLSVPDLVGYLSRFGRQVPPGGGGGNGIRRDKQFLLHDVLLMVMSSPMPKCWTSNVQLFLVRGTVAEWMFPSDIFLENKNKIGGTRTLNGLCSFVYSGDVAPSCVRLPPPPAPYKKRLRRINGIIFSLIFFLPIYTGRVISG